MSEMNDDSAACADWSNRKLHNEIDAALAAAIGAPTPGQRLGYLAGARALLDILCERTQKAARTPSE